MNIDFLIPYIWLGLAALGLGIALVSLTESITDYRVTRPTNGFRILALGDLAQESLRVVLYLLFAGIGLLYLGSDREVQRSGVAWVMVGAEAILVFKTVIQIGIRRHIRVTHGRILGEAETQNQREDREFGEARRELEQVHLDD